MSNYLELTAALQELEQGMPPLSDAGFLGARVDPDDAALVLLPVPWEATTSYGGGTSQGPQAILRASHQLDLGDEGERGGFGAAYRAGIAYLSELEGIAEKNSAARNDALEVIAALERGETAKEQQERVNRAGAEVNRLVHVSAVRELDRGKLVGLVGGDHSSPYGLIQALAERHIGGFGVLHFDAHHDLRRAYEGFQWSHASIFYNVMEHIPQVRKLVQVGIRDYSRAERRYSDNLGEQRTRCFYGRDLFRMKAEGMPFHDIARLILEDLPALVYVSFDIDVLDPPYCPSTGTPVPGGLSYDEAIYILELLAAGGRKVIGFDLCEVAPGPEGDEWDANVGARMLYALCGCLLRSQGRS